MRKRLPVWLRTRPEGAKGTRLVGVLWATCALPALLHAANPAISAAQQSANALKGGRFDSKQAIQNNAIGPLQGRNKMRAQSGQTFDASVQCAQAQPMLTLLGSPGNTGDLQSLIVSADLNLDGTPDSTISPARPVSGVCANGLVSCDAGTWNNCTAWSWVATASQINLQTVGMRQLKGCYCINNSCGSSLSWSNLGLILSDLGSGAAQAIQKVYPNYVISSTSNNGAQVEFFGADSSGCATGGRPPTQYLANSATLGADLNAKVTADTANPKSLYSIVTNSPAATASATTTNSCTISRTVPVTDDTCTIQPDVIQDSCQTLANNPDCVLKSENVDGVTTYSRYAPTGLVPLPITKTVTSSTGFYPAPATLPYDLSSVHYAYAETSTAFITVTDINLARQYSRTGCIKKSRQCIWRRAGQRPGGGVLGLSWGWTRTGRTRKTTTTTGGILGTGGTIIEYEWCRDIGNYGFKPGTNVIWVSGGCRGNFTVSGLIPKPCGHDVTRDWWTKKQVWECKAQPSKFNFDDALHRADVAQRTAVLGSGFTETHRDANGNWIEQKIALGAPAALPTVGACEPVCKVSKTVVDDRVNPLRTAASNRLAPTTRKVFRYPRCVNNKCPTEPGEVIEKGCQCVNDFAEAATIMQMLRQAGQDVTCAPAATQ